MKSDIKFFALNELKNKLEQHLQAGDILISEERFKYLLPTHPHILFKTGGEEIKTFSQFEILVDQILTLKPHRKNNILVLGGGALSDLAGFAAATVVRGLPWIVIPTTLLSQVDASVGGKVAINTKHGKNLMGAFHAPEAIWIIEEFLGSLPLSQLESGRGEILKYAFLNENIASMVRNKAPLPHIVRACLQYKSDIVKQDPKEIGVRKTLNLGHTYGHAYEMVYNLYHGKAVTLGIKTILEKYSPKLLKDFELLLQALDLNMPENLEITDQVKQFILADKKKTADNMLELIVPDRVGHVEIKKIKLDQI